MFRKASPKRAFEDVALQIREAIVQGRLQPGDRLPSQRELKELFQVSRSAIMEALRVLEKADLITIRAGATGGAFVSHATSDTVAEALLLLLSLEGVSLAELAEFRERLEGGTAYWAALRADEKKLELLERRLSRLEELAAARTPWGAFLAEEMRFHWDVAEGSANRPSVATMKAITRAMEEAYRFISPGLYQKVLSDIRGIFEAIRNRQPEVAEQRMKSHIAYFNDNMMANRSRSLQLSYSPRSDGRPEAPLPDRALPPDAAISPTDGALPR
ncbi:MAG: FadR/GntR family transcriptional regulator [Chloroflexota bacterium]